MHHSTHLKTLEEHCDVAYKMPVVDREQFHVGTAAHAVLERATLSQPKSQAELEFLAQTVCAQLMQHGRSFDGVPEPPLPPNQVLEGRDIALAYMAEHGIPQGDPEIGLAVGDKGYAVGYEDKTAYYGAVHDLIEFWEDGDEDGWLYRVVMSTDYKTAWPTNADELDTLQRKGQAVTLFAHYADQVDVIRQRIVNLRTGAEWSRDIWLDDEGRDQVSGWWEDVLLLCKKADHVKADDHPTARPGINCIGCHYSTQCPDAYCAATGNSAVAFAAAKELVTSVGKRLRGETKDSTPVPTGDGYIGYKTKQRRVLKEDAATRLVTWWLKGETPTADDMRAMLVAADIGTTNAEKLAKVMFPGRSGAADRKVFIDEITETVNYAEFGLWK